jgi:hypothetical protein
MAARKSIAKDRRVGNSGPARVAGSSGERACDEDHMELLEDLSAQLALVETVSIALQKFENRQEVGAICTSLERAVRRLADEHERVGHYLLREQR